MENLIERAQELAREQQRQRVERIAAALRAQLSRSDVEMTATGVRISGGALFRRWLTDPALRFVGMLSR